MHIWRAIYSKLFLLLILAAVFKKSLVRRSSIWRKFSKRGTFWNLLLTIEGGNVVVISTSNELTSQSVATLATLPSLGAAGGCVTATSTSCVTPTAAPTRQSASSSSSSQSNGGTCVHCNKTFRQLRSHIQDVHCPTPTPCPLCGKMFSSKHKMFGHKYRSCPNRTRNLVRHLQDLEGQPGQQQQQQQQQQHLQNNENQQPFWLVDKK